MPHFELFKQASYRVLVCTGLLHDNPAPPKSAQFYSGAEPEEQLCSRSYFAPPVHVTLTDSKIDPCVPTFNRRHSQLLLTTTPI